jgi:hypothetical protein
MMYGLRRSELAGLKWSAVDFQNDTLTIRHTVTQYKTRVAKDETKNKASHRTLLSLNVFESFLRNNGRVVVLIKITAFHAVIPNLLTVLCHCFLEQSASDLFFVGNEFVDGLTIPLRFSGWRGDTLRRQTSRNLAKTVAGEVSLENPEDDFGFGFIDAKTAVIRFAVSVTGAVGHFGSTIPEAFADTAFDGEFF